MTARTNGRTLAHGLARTVRAVGAFVWRARRRVAIGLVGALASPFVLVAVMAALTKLPAELLEPAAPSLRVLSRGGRLLREVRADDGARARPMPLAELPRHAIDAVLAAEDRRFYSHHGVDLRAVARAAFADVIHARIVSGASTITMQLARTLRPHRRSLWGKVKEAALALRIEASLSKDNILEEYLNRVVYGPNLRGYAAASFAYFGVAPASLSVAESALIAGLPRGPELYSVTRHPAMARRRRDRVLSRMAEAGSIDAGERDRAMAEPIAPSLERPSFGAPHLVSGIVSGSLATVQPGLLAALGDRRGLSELTTTIDPELQRSAEVAVTTTLAALTAKHVTAAAVLVLDNASGDVLAYVGSPDYWGAEALGQNDGVRALRQPGSSLKPFVYAEAMSRLGYTGATLLPDVEVHIPLPGGGDYVPHDYDTRFHGPTRLREALGNSLNVPAVYTLYQLGTAHVLDRLHSFGFESLIEDAEHYGPALALGDGEVTLLELANAYATLARGGLRCPVRIVTKLVRAGTSSALPPVGPCARVVDERVASMLTDILSDKTARMSAFGDQNVLELDFDVAAKTGTSKGYRDNVAVGYTREVTVAAWAGNFDGSNMSEVSGISGAGPIFHAVMEAAMEGRPRVSLSVAGDAARLGLERTAVCALSGEVPTSLCPHKVYEWLPAGDASHAPTCSVHERVRVDRRSGLRAGPDCPDDMTEERTFERWGAPYDTWAARMGRPVPPAESSPACPIAEATEGSAAGATPRVSYPFDGERFVVDPERPPALQMLQIRVDPFEGHVDVRVDGEPLGPTRQWQLTPGSHTILAASGALASTPVHISVR
jgi:penicillin-binding protein 1C